MTLGTLAILIFIHNFTSHSTLQPALKAIQPTELMTSTWLQVGKNVLGARFIDPETVFFSANEFHD